MMKNNHSLGGENSGHIIFSKYAKTGDGILTSIKIMEVMLESKLPISDLSKEMTTYPQVLKNVRVADKKAAREDERVKAAVKEAEEKLAGEGRVLLRESGTEPVIRVMAEAATMEGCEKVVDDLIEVLAKCGHVC